MIISKKLTNKPVHLVYWTEMNGEKIRQDRTGMMKYVGSKSIIFEPFENPEISLSNEQINLVEEIEIIKQ